MSLPTTVCSGACLSTSPRSNGFRQQPWVWCNLVSQASGSVLWRRRGFTQHHALNNGHEKDITQIHTAHPRPPCLRLKCSSNIILGSRHIVAPTCVVPGNISAQTDGFRRIFRSFDKLSPPPSTLSSVPHPSSRFYSISGNLWVSMPADSSPSRASKFKTKPGIAIQLKTSGNLITIFRERPRPVESKGG